MESSQENGSKKIKICAVCGAQATGNILFFVISNLVDCTNFKNFFTVYSI